ncbi:MAG TPA: metal-sulfur cluster assembly factor [Candidatus Kapabacteria bacterium]|nr:metal-sulfur cluster assembly factor [Candidatus Kapabacteria bacterium]
MKIYTNDERKCNIAQAVLKNVIDPEVGLNIVDLGLVYEINFIEDEKVVACLMTLTTEFCPMGESIVEDTTQTLQAAFADYKIEVELTFDPAWSFELVSEEGRLFLGR